MQNRLFVTTICISLFIFMHGCAEIQNEQKQNKLRCYLDNASPIQKYQMEVAYQVNKNWEFSNAKNPGSAEITTIVFKIMPNGEIKDISFVKRSGNEVLDQSAFNAVEKTNPTKPFPPSIQKPFVEMGLKFSPKDLKK